MFMSSSFLQIHLLSVFFFQHYPANERQWERTVQSISVDSEMNVIPCTVWQYVENMDINLIQQYNMSNIHIHWVQM